MTTTGEVRPADYAALAQFNAAFPGETLSAPEWQQRFAHWWDDNPAFDETVARGWIARDESGSIVGFVGSIPSRFQLNGKEVRALSATTWRVAPEHRGASMQLYAAHIESGRGALLFNCTPNPTVERVLQYFHYQSLPAYATAKTYLVPLRTRAVVDAFFIRRRDAGMLSMPARVAVGLMALTSRTLTRVQSDASTRILEDAPSEADALWNRTRGQTANTSVRDRAHLQWWCFGNPDRKKTLVGAYDGTRLIGYAVFRQERWRGISVAELVDCWGDATAPRYLRACVAAGIRHAESVRADLVALHAYRPEHAAVFRALGAFSTVDDPRRFYYRAGDDEAPVTLPHDATYLTGIDGDFAV